MRRTLTCLVVIASGAFASPVAFAQDRPAPPVLGWGNVPCSQWSHVRKSNDEPAHVVTSALLGWVEGYVTAATLGSDDAAKKFPSMENGDAVTAWIDGYCAGHPTESIAQASIVYAAHLAGR
jgi:hypothetical protein